METMSPLCCHKQKVLHLQDEIQFQLPLKLSFSPIPGVFRTELKARSRLQLTDRHARAAGPWGWTDLRVEGGCCCARAADKLHKEGPVLRSERRGAAAGARGWRMARGPAVNHCRRRKGQKKQTKTRREGEKDGHMRGKGERKRERETHPPRRKISKCKALAETHTFPGRASQPCRRSTWGKVCPSASALIRAKLGCLRPHIALNVLQTHAKGTERPQSSLCVCVGCTGQEGGQCPGLVGRLPGFWKIHGHLKLAAKHGSRWEKRIQ